MFYMYFFLFCNFVLSCLKIKLKVEKMLKGSLDSIPSPSPSVKIQIMGRKVCLRCKGIAQRCQQSFVNKKFDDITQQCYAFTTQVNFPANNLNVLLYFLCLVHLLVKKKLVAFKTFWLRSIFFGCGQIFLIILQYANLRYNITFDHGQKNLIIFKKYLTHWKLSMVKIFLME